MHAYKQVRKSHTHTRHALQDAQVFRAARALAEQKKALDHVEANLMIPEGVKISKLRYSYDVVKVLKLRYRQ